MQASHGYKKQGSNLFHCVSFLDFYFNKTDSGLSKLSKDGQKVKGLTWSWNLSILVVSPRYQRRFACVCASVCEGL